MTLRVEQLHDGAVQRLVLAAPKGNVLDTAMLAALCEAFVAVREHRGCKAVLLAAEGRHFSFGASVEEHLPGRVDAMLELFHRVFDAIAAAAVPVVAAVRGQCLGGGLELAAYCHRVVAAPDARLGQPEITLGVFAPVGSLLLGARVGQGVADELLLSGRSVDASEALRIGLVDELADDPDAAARAWVEQNLLPRSASSLRHATRAARWSLDRRLRRELDELTQLYLDELMSTADAVEGLTAFLEKRPPRWSDA